MFLINCPYCGERDQAEFSCGGEAHIARPKNPPELSDDQWAEYLFLRKNEKGIHYERWNHEYGCRQWFNLARNTSTDEILAVLPGPCDILEDEGIFTPPKMSSEEE